MTEWSGEEIPHFPLTLKRRENLVTAKSCITRPDPPLGVPKDAAELLKLCRSAALPAKTPFEEPIGREHVDAEVLRLSQKQPPRFIDNRTACRRQNIVRVFPKRPDRLSDHALRIYSPSKR